MRKVLNNSNLHGRTWLAITLSISLAAFACTTNRNPGEGEPYIGGPGLGPSSPTSNMSSNRSTSVMPPPMTSSYQRNDALPTATMTTRSSRLPLSPDEAAAVLAQSQPRVRVLGASNPGVSGGYHSDSIVTGQVANVAAMTNPQMTINSSISSPGGGAAITSGAGGAVGSTNAGVVISGSSIVANSTDGTVTTTDSGAPVFGGDSRIITPTNAAIPLTPGMFAAGAASPATAVITPRTAPTPVTTSGTGTSPVTVPVRATTTSKSTVNGSGSVRVITMDGRTVVTNGSGNR
jgi:hypothetical protein